MLPERCKKPRPKCAIGRTGSLPINPTNLLKFLEQTQSKLQIRQLLPAQNCFHDVRRKMFDSLPRPLHPKGRMAFHKGVQMAKKKKAAAKRKSALNKSKGMLERVVDAISPTRPNSRGGNITRRQGV